MRYAARPFIPLSKTYKTIKGIILHFLVLVPCLCRGRSTILAENFYLTLRLSFLLTLIRMHTRTLFFPSSGLHIFFPLFAFPFVFMILQFVFWGVVGRRI